MVVRSFVPPGVPSGLLRGTFDRTSAEFIGAGEASFPSCVRASATWLMPCFTFLASRCNVVAVICQVSAQRSCQGPLDERVARVPSPDCRPGGGIPAPSPKLSRRTAISKCNGLGLANRAGTTDGRRAVRTLVLVPGDVAAVPPFVPERRPPCVISPAFCPRPLDAGNCTIGRAGGAAATPEAGASAMRPASTPRITSNPAIKVRKTRRRLILIWNAAEESPAG